MLHVLARRGDFLTALVEQPLRKNEITEQFATSRSTVDRAVRELEQVELIERTSEGYQATLCGVLAMDSRELYRQKISNICMAAPMISVLSVDIPFSSIVLDEADIYIAKPYAPDASINEILDIVRGASRIRSLAPIVLDQYVVTYYDRVVNHERETELILSPEVIDRLVSVYTDRFSEVLRSSNATVYESAVSPPFGLVLLMKNQRQQMALIAYTATGIQGVILNEAPMAVAWAEDVYREFKKDAKRLSTAFQ